MRLALDGSGRLRHTCTCAENDRADAPRLCQTQANAVEAALDLLGTSQRPAAQSIVAGLAAALAVPTATRRARSYLAELGIDGPTTVTLNGAPAEPVWRLHQDRDGGWHLTPGLSRAKQTGPGQMVRAWSMERASQHLRLHGDARERALLEPSQALDGFRTYDRAARQVKHTLQDQLLRYLTGHPAVYLAKGGAGPVVLRDEELQMRIDRQGGDVHISTFFGDRPAVAVLAERHDPFPSGWRGQRLLRWPEVPARGADPVELRVVHASPEALSALRLEQAGAHRLPLGALPELRSRLIPLAQRGDVVFSEQVRGARVEGQVEPTVELGFDGKSSRFALRVEPLHGGGLANPGAGSIAWYAMRDTEPVYCERDTGRETQVAAELWRQLNELTSAVPALTDETPEDTPWSAHITDLDGALELIDWLRRASAAEPAGDAAEPADDSARYDDAAEEPIPARWRGLQIKWDSAPVRLLGLATAANLRVQIDEGRDWFGVTASLDIQGATIPLAQLLAAARDARRYVHVEGKGWLRMEEGLRRRLGAVAAAGGRLSPLAAPVLMALEEEGAEISAPTKWLQMSDRIRRAATLQPTTPRGLTAELRAYQQDGFAWLARLATWAPGAVLADDMGLGKTIQALALLLRRAALGPALVVAPTSLGFNWQREAERFAPGLELRALRGRASVAVLDGIGPNVVVITSWEVAHLQVERLKALTWSTLVMDEAQAIKNPSTRRAKAMFALDADFRLALTGTPMENHTGELWSLFRAAVPGLLGTQKDFRKRFQIPIERHGDARARAALAALISPFLLRRLKSAVAQDLPPRTDVLLDIELSAPERRRYEQLRASVAAELAKPASPEERSQTRRFRVLAALTRLRQLACHPALVDPSYQGKSAKLEELLRRLAALRAEGHRALVFSQFTSLLDLVRPALEAQSLRILQLDGRTPARQRRALVDAFQAGQADVFLLSIKAGGTGLNLTAASYVFHLDPWWNPAVEDQATDRAHRIGQGKQVVVYRLVARQTVEESIYALHDEKRALTDALLSGASKSGPIGVEELEALLLTGGEAGIPEDEPAEDILEDESVVTAPQTEALWFAPPTQVSALAVTELLGLQRRLERALALGKIGRRASARSVARQAGRYLAWAEATGVPLATVADREVAKRYAAAIRDGAWTAPSSDVAAATTTARWLGRG